MNIGQLDRLIEILERDAGVGSTGQPHISEHTFASVWAKVEPMSGGEVLDAPGRIARQTAKFTIRFRSGVTASMRIKFDGQFYDITDVAELGRREGLVLTAEVVQRTGGVVAGGGS